MANVRRYRWRARAQIEAGVVPRAAHLAAADESFGNRPRVVGARGADREHFARAPRQHHRVTMRVAEEEPAAYEIVQSNTSGRGTTDGHQAAH
jgi:hypothetical protein